jgi:drug/metabolite transporter (DMT)-like permease
LQQEENTIKTKLAFLAICFIWGSTYLAIRIGVQYFPPALLAGARFIIAGLIVVIYAKIKGLAFPSAFHEYWRIAIIGVLLLGTGSGMVFFASKWINSGMSSLMIATTPLIMSVIESLILRRRTLSLRGWIGLLTGFGGVALLVLSNSQNEAMHINGVLLLLFSSLSWSVGSLYSREFHLSGDLIPHIGIQMMFGGIAVAILGVLLGETAQLQMSLVGLGALIYLIFFGSIIAFSSYIYVLHHWPAAKAGTYAYVNPLVALTLGALVLDEKISFPIVISAAVILGSVYVVQTSKVTEITATK